MNVAKYRFLCPWRMLTVLFRIACIAILIGLLFANWGCAGTRLYTAGGHKQFETTADIKGLVYHGADGSSLTAEEINHSNLVGKAISGASSTIMNALAFLAAGGLR